MFLRVHTVISYNTRLTCFMSDLISNAIMTYHGILDGKRWYREVLSRYSGEPDGLFLFGEKMFHRLICTYLRSRLLISWNNWAVEPGSQCQDPGLNENKSRNQEEGETRRG